MGFLMRGPGQHRFHLGCSGYDLLGRIEDVCISIDNDRQVLTGTLPEIMPKCDRSF